MKVADRFHLVYCSNIHPGETWPAVDAALRASLPKIRALLNVDGPLGVGLRLSAAAAATLEHPPTLANFRAFLDDGGYYVPTINGFPYGAFHGQRVKERVYLPDWREGARVEYSDRLARLLAALLEHRPDIEGSVSTVPGAFRSAVASEADVAAMASNFLRHAAELTVLRARTGRTITLAIEPEPACFIETTDDAVGFFRRYLFDEVRIAAIARERGDGLTGEDVRRHLGICFDACHAAVEFEDPEDALTKLSGAGIRVCKVQVSSALQLDGRDAAALASALTPFAEDTYLHQVVERASGRLVRYPDLPDALQAVSHADPREKRDWRVHFHVPIFLRAMNALETTQPYLESVLQLLKRGEISSCLEVETYTWDVLPPEYRTVDVCTAIARELTWARSILES